MKILIVLALFFSLFGCQSTQNTRENNDYLVTVVKKIEINAPIDDVWNTHIDINNWNKWHSDISESKLESKIGLGETFIWKSSGFKITSKITKFEINKAMAWTGVAFGAVAKHSWQFESLDKSRTLVTTSESMNGWLVSLFTSKMNKDLNLSLEKWLILLKIESESGVNDL